MPVCGCRVLLGLLGSDSRAIHGHLSQNPEPASITFEHSFRAKERASSIFRRFLRASQTLQLQLWVSTKQLCQRGMSIGKDGPNAFCRPMLTVAQAKTGLPVPARASTSRYWQRLEQTLAAFSNSGSRLGVARGGKGVHKAVEVV